MLGCLYSLQTSRNFSSVSVVGSASARIPMFDFRHIGKYGKDIHSIVVPKALFLKNK